MSLGSRHPAGGKLAVPTSQWERSCGGRGESGMVAGKEDQEGFMLLLACEWLRLPTPLLL